MTDNHRSSVEGSNAGKMHSLERVTIRTVLYIFVALHLIALIDALNMVESLIGAAKRRLVNAGHRLSQWVRADTP